VRSVRSGERYGRCCSRAPSRPTRPHGRQRKEHARLIDSASLLLRDRLSKLSSGVLGLSRSRGMIRNVIKMFRAKLDNQRQCHAGFGWLGLLRTQPAGSNRCRTMNKA
jgi:hypothetical protein